MPRGIGAFGRVGSSRTEDQRAGHVGDAVLGSPKHKSAHQKTVTDPIHSLLTDINMGDWSSPTCLLGECNDSDDPFVNVLGIMSRWDVEEQSSRMVLLGLRQRVMSRVTAFKSIIMLYPLRFPKWF